MSSALNAVGNLTFVVLLLVVLGAFLAPHLLDVTFHTIISESMTPTIKVGDVVALNKRVTAEEIEVGDIVAFTAEGIDIPVTHRVVEIVKIDDGIGIRTQGDALEEPDPWIIRPDQLLGRVAFHVPALGYVSRFVKTRYGFGLLIVLPALMVVALQAKEVLQPPRRTSREGIGIDRPDRTPAYLWFFASLVVTGSLWGLVAGNIEKRPLSSFDEGVAEDGSAAVHRRTIRNDSPFPLVLCLKSEDADVNFSEKHILLRPGAQRGVEMQGNSEEALVVTAGFLPLLPQRVLYSLFTWNTGLAAFLAAVIPLLPVAMIGFVLLGGLGPSRPDPRKRARYLRRLGYM